jgi:phosphoserine phosphatase RsbU/P
MNASTPNPTPTWQERLDQIADMMREMSAQTDPQVMVSAYGQRVRKIQANDGFIAVSRRGLAQGQYKITRATAWTDSPDPWKEPHKFPIRTTGILGQWLYEDKPKLIQNFQPPKDDPAYDLFMGSQSVAIIPQYDGGTSLNMVVVLKKEPNGFDPEKFPEVFWQSNLFGRATSNLVLSKQVKQAYETLDRELKSVADIQRSLLPTKIPIHAGLDLATHYQTSQNAGGDYYDFFELPNGKLGILMADVSGHGTPAAVLMAILHAIAHMREARNATSPRHWMNIVNQELCERYTLLTGTFITAFYAVFDPTTGDLTYASAGHNPPRLRLAHQSQSISVIDELTGKPTPQTAPGKPVVLELDQAQGLPLGIEATWEYSDTQVNLKEGDILVLYTDGFTEAMNPESHLYGVERLDQVLSQDLPTSRDFAKAIIADVAEFAKGRSPNDDRTMVIARVLSDEQCAQFNAGRTHTDRADIDVV